MPNCPSCEAQQEGYLFCSNCRSIYKERYKRTKQSQQQLRPDCDQVFLRLFVGNCDAALCPKTLKSLNIKSILAAGFQLYTPHPDIKYLQLEIEDSQFEDISVHFQQCSRFINEGIKRGSVLVHCAAGVSRSPSIIVAYLMQNRKLSFSRALYLLRKKRNVVKPNRGFLNQLKGFEQIKE